MIPVDYVYDAGRWVATSPLYPGVKGSGNTKTSACQDLINKIRNDIALEEEMRWEEVDK